MLFYCGNQWGYTPVGVILNIPTGYCNPPTGLTANVYAQYATLSWIAPHDYLKFILEYRVVGDPTWIAVDVFGQSYMLTLVGTTNYEWRVKTVCSTAPVRESTYAVGPNFITFNAVAGCTAVTSVQVTYLGDRYRLSWAPTGAQYYTVEVRIKGTATPRTYTVQGTFLELTALVKGETYEARVIATCQNITMTPVPSPWVEWVVANLTCPMPGNVNYTAGITTILLSWLPVGIGYTYNIYVNNLPVILAYPGTTYTLQTLTPFTVYNIKVVTNCGDGLSPAQEITVKTLAVTCNPPVELRVVTASVTPTGFDVAWTPALGIASQQIILNNGAPIALGAAIATYSFTNLVPGSNNTVVVRSVCTSNVSPDATTSLQLAGCAAVTGLVLTPHATTIDASWNPVANAVKYRVLATKVSDSSTAYSGTVFSTFAVFPLLLPATDYIISVTTECAAGLLATPVTGNATTLAKPACVNAIIDTQAVGPTTIDILTWHFADGRTTGFFEYRLIRVSDSAQLANGQMSAIAPINFTGLAANTAYKVFIFDRGDASATLNCTPAEITTITTAAPCEPPTNVVATMITNNTQIQVSLTLSVSNPPTYQLYFQEAGSTVWQGPLNIPFLSFPTTVGPVPAGKYKVRVRSLCTTSQSVWVESNYGCPMPSNVVSQLAGNGVHIQWDALVGINTYSVVLTRTADGVQSIHSTNTNYIDIANLLYGANYTYTVTAICDENAGTGMTSPIQTFTTAPAPPERVSGCVDPIFTAFVQDCGVTDPGGIGGGGGGGGPIDGGGGGVGADCSVAAQDWALVNALFAAVADDAPNDTFLEATFEIAQSIANGVLAAMPGGIMGVINAACLPASTASVTIEVVLGGELEVGSGTYATNGNITVAGSYTSDGSTRLVVRLRGNYNKV